MNVTTCRICEGTLRSVFNLGLMPLVNYFPTKEEIGKEKWLPLRLCMCEKCGFLQLGYIVAPEKLFRTYHYISGASSPLVSHLKKLAHKTIKQFHLRSTSKILDIGSNDGTLLHAFIEAGIPNVLGVEPAKNISSIAKKRSVPTISEFFDEKIAGIILKKHGRFDLVTVTHSLANIVDLHGYMRGVKKLLKEKGHIVIEVGDRDAILKKGQFDSIYHEHYNYFSLNDLEKLLHGHGLVITHSQKNDFHGGSIRITATKSYKQKHDNTFGKLSSVTFIEPFIGNIQEYKKEVTKIVRSLEGKTIVGIGAPAKAVTYIHYCALAKDITFVVDSTAFKQGRYIPGTKIPIYAENYLKKDTPQVIIIFAWNYQKEILKKLKALVLGKPIVIIPFPRLQTKKL